MQLRHAIPLMIMALAGCDKITGVAEQKSSDAEAIGYACRVSLKKPEDCMKENEAQSPTAVLTGWKSADQDISKRKLDPSMGSDPATAVHIKAASAPGETGEAKSEASDKETAEPKSSEGKPHKSH